MCEPLRDFLCVRIGLDLQAFGGRCTAVFGLAYVGILAANGRRIEPDLQAFGGSCTDVLDSFAGRWLGTRWA